MLSRLEDRPEKALQKRRLELHAIVGMMTIGSSVVITMTHRDLR